MFKNIFYFFLLVSSFFPTLGYSWCDAGHMLVAEIAYQKLSAEARQAILTINDTMAKKTPQFGSIHSAATYPDKSKDYPELWSWDVWHFTNIPYDPEHFLSEEQKQKIVEQNKNNDVIFGINETIKFLSCSPDEGLNKWYMYAYLLHFVADIHQPLHCSTLYSSKYPEGNRGGNLFLIAGMKQKNLHSFWDFALDTLPDMEALEQSEIESFIKVKSQQMMAKYPPCFFTDLQDINPRNWAEESAEYAHSLTFHLQEGEIPHNDYLDRGREIAEQRLTLAGYRLAFVLNHIFAQPQL